MPNPQIIEEKPITMAELKDELDSVKKRDKELDFRANRMMDYLQQTMTLSSAKSKELYKELEKLNIPRLKDVHICKMVDILPSTVDEVKVILQAYTISITNDNIKKIVDVVKKYKK